MECRCPKEQAQQVSDQSWTITSWAKAYGVSLELGESCLAVRRQG